MPCSTPAHSLIGIPIAYFVFVSAEFAALTHMTLSVAAQGRSTVVIGLIAGALWAGILVTGSIAHRFIDRLGHGRVFVLGCTVAVLSLVGLALATGVGLWMVGTFALGAGGGLVWVTGESWLVEAAPAPQRGRYVGLYEASVGFGLLVGPLLVPLAQSWGAQPLRMAAVIMGLAWVLALVQQRLADPLPKAREHTLETGTTTPWLASLSPFLAMAFLAGFMESGVASLLPSITVRLGSSTDTAALLGAFIGAGSALLQPPAGSIADRWGTASCIAASWLILLATSIVLLTLASAPGEFLWVAGFVLAGVGGAVYTLCIVELGNRLDGARLVKAIAALITSYSLGTTCSPVAGGYAFELLAMQGFAAMHAVLCLVGMFLAWSTLRLRKHQGSMNRPGNPEVDVNHAIRLPGHGAEASNPTPPDQGRRTE